jgi:hypothetical protein
MPKGKGYGKGKKMKGSHRAGKQDSEPDSPPALWTGRGSFQKPRTSRG